MEFIDRVSVFLVGATFLAMQASAASVDIDSANIDLHQWMYFGWEEDHPKAIALMGGGLYPRRPKLPANDDESWKYSKIMGSKNCDKLILFELSVDGSAPFYPNEKSLTRKTDIHWSRAEGYLPFPVSSWQHEGVAIQITHVGRRLCNGNLDAVFTRVQMINADAKKHSVSLRVCGQSVSSRTFPLGNYRLFLSDDAITTNPVKLSSGSKIVYEWVSLANGEVSRELLQALGGFSSQYQAEKRRITSKMKKLTMPVSLPDEGYVNLWKSSMTDMWNATVKTSFDYEQRGSGGNVYGYYQYDRTFNHDVPDMVIAYIMEGNWDVARQIMDGLLFKNISQGHLDKEVYLDAIPKYIVTLSQYLQFTGDEQYFDSARMESLRTCARVVAAMRDGQFSDEARKLGVYGLIRKGQTLDNNFHTYLIVDNFAALHGFTAYKYICDKLHRPDESKWAFNQMVDLNNCLNKAIEKSLTDAHIDWYNACFSFDMDNNLVSGPGNWLGTTFSMPTFPWNAWLKGFNLGGAWRDHLDSSVAKWAEVARSCGCPEGSWGAWWNAKYGAVYNTGMVMPLLYSDKYRTLIAQSIDWLLDNQSAPLLWGESFYKPAVPGDWTKPETDLETWGLAFIRQAMLQMCVSVKANSDVIIGRGIPDNWVNSQKKISWKRVHINAGKIINLTIQRRRDIIDISINGDVNSGNYIVDLPVCKSNIKDVKVSRGAIVVKNLLEGKITVTGNSRDVKIILNH
jgi:hypothetical protein